MLIGVHYSYCKVIGLNVNTILLANCQYMDRNFVQNVRFTTIQQKKKEPNNTYTSKAMVE